MSSERLPRFKYHPDPVSTGAITPSDAECECCGEARGYIYTGAPHAEEDLEAICPWCIADGSAAEEFDAEFVDAHSLEQAGLSDDIIEEVTKRTPGFESWQGERWLAHCEDACQFLGNLPADRLSHLDEDDRRAIMSTLPISWIWESVEKIYEPAGQPGIYWFKCRHCGNDLYYADYT